MTDKTISPLGRTEPHEQIVRSATLRCMHHSGHDAARNAPLPAQARPEPLSGEGYGDDGNRVEIGDADILECDATASPPQPLRGRAEERGGSPLRQSILATPDRFLECAHRDPRRDVQRLKREGLRFGNCISELLSSDAQDVVSVHSSSPSSGVEGSPMNVGPNLNDEPVTAHVKWVRQIISSSSADTAAISRERTDRVLKFITQGNAPTVSTRPRAACLVPVEEQPSHVASSKSEMCPSRLSLPSFDPYAPKTNRVPTAE